MMRRASCVIVAMTLAGGPQGLWAQAGEDPDVARGVKQVDDGDYDGAILTLDNAARRLSAQSGKERDLAQAYLYLGVAYMGKGAETSAKARFRDALAQAKDLNLSPEKFPPKVINLFEAAREELERTPPAASKDPTPEPAPAPKKGGSKALWVLLGVAAVGGGVLVAAGGKSSAGVSPTPSPSPTGTTTQTLTGNVGPSPSGCNNVNLPVITPTRSGTLTATLTWPDATQVLGMSLALASNGNDVADSRLASNTSAQLTAQVTNTTYGFSVCRTQGTGVESFQIVATYPQ